MCVCLSLSLSQFLLHPPSLTHRHPLSCLYLSIFRSRSCLFRSSLRLSSVRFLSSYRHRYSSPSLDHPFSLARSPLVPISIFLSLISSVFTFLLLCPSHAPHHRRLACTSIEPAEHRPILHLNLVNLPELANELRAWCLILAHEYSRRYTTSNASGEDTYVQSPTKIVSNRKKRFPSDSVVVGVILKVTMY